MLGASIRGKKVSWRKRSGSRSRVGERARLQAETLEQRLVLDSTVVFNEIFYHQAEQSSAPEWIELHNQMSVDMDISGWRIDGGVEYEFAAGTIVPGGGYLVVTSDVARLQATAGVADALGPFEGRLSNSGEQLVLWNNDDRQMDAIDYRDSGDWPVVADGSGASLAKRLPNASSDSARNWRASLEVGGTPAKRNFASDVPLFETVVTQGDTARYYVPTDGALGNVWTERDFDDSAWPSGPTGIGYDALELDHVAEVLSDSPVGFWRFEETGGTTAFDSSGNGRHATYNGGATLGTDGMLQGDGDRAVRLDGSTGRVVLPGTWGGTDWTELTIEAWVKTADPISGDFQSVVSGHNPNAFAHFQLFSAGNTGVYTDVGFVATPVIPATPTGQWRHVAITSRSGESKVYVNGEQVGSAVAATYTNILASANVTIGQGHENGRWFRGEIDEVAIYDRALPEARIVTHYLAGTSGSGNPDPNPDAAELLAHWTFDGDGSDETGNHSATLGGGASITAESAVGSGALDLRDVNGYADVATTVLAGASSFSMAYWVAADTLNALCCSSVFSNDGWSPGKVRININSGSGNIEFGVNGNSALPTSVGSVPADGSWVHVAQTYDSASGTLTTYLNGTAEPSVTLEMAVPAGVGGGTIGAWDATGSGLYTRFLDGRIDDLRVYGGVLTASEVTDLASMQGAPAAGDLGSLPISAYGVITTDIQQQMQDVSASTYLRREFTVVDAGRVDELLLRMQYDDAFVAYLNGVEVARSNVQDPVSFNTTAAAERSNAAAVQYEQFNLKHALDLLVDGRNVLAIQGINLTVDDDDFLVSPEVLIHVAEIEELTLAFNEVAGAQDAEFALELTNYGDAPITLGGMRVGAAYDVGAGYTLPNSILPAGGFLTITESELGYRPTRNANVFLYTADGRGVVDGVRVADTLRGRSPDGTGAWFHPHTATPNLANVFQWNDQVVINEIMYHAPPTLATPGTPARYSVETFLPIDAVWKYNASNTDLGTAWRAVDYDDASWSSGAGLLGFETNPAALPEPLRTFIAPHTGKTYYFRTEFNFDGDPSSVELMLRHVFDDGAVIYLNGQEWYRVGMPPGEVSFSTEAERTVADAIYEGPVALPTDRLLVGTNVLAVEVHQRGTASSDLVMGLELIEQTLVEPAIPGEPYAESQEEWIELYNRSDSPMDLSGWRLRGGADFDFAPGTTIPPQSYLVVANDAERMRLNYPGIAIVGNWSGGLSNASDEIRLLDAVGNPADEVRYFDEGRWSFHADGNGSTLELIDPNADNARAEAWAASDESADSPWQTVTYRGVAVGDIGPTNFNELIVGLLDAGEVLLDDIQVIENPGRPGARQLIQNGDFESGDASRWRILGNHDGSQVEVDPDNPGNHVLRLVATGAMEHLSNHAETTLKDGNTFVTISSSREYEISFRAKWLAGSRQLRTNLYFNRLPQVTILEGATNSGTPGQSNSRRFENLGPTYTDLQHTPVVPAVGESVTVSVVPTDADGIEELTLWYSVNGGAFASVPMIADARGVYRGSIPGQSAAATVQFYVNGTDNRGAASMFPAAGAGSRALYKVQDGLAELGTLNNFRIVMTEADTDKLLTNTNLMSNDLLGATIIYNESEVFYNAGVQLKGSPYGRPEAQFVSYIVHFQPDQLFRGVHSSVVVDRSARGPVGSPNVDELLIRHVFDHAGGVASQYGDIIRAISPRASLTSVAQLNMARYGDVFLDSSFDNAGDSPVFEFDGAYYLTRTTDGTPEGLKIVEPGPISYTDIRDLGDDKEAYRNNWIIKDRRDEDNYDPIIALNKAFSLTGPALDAAIDEMIDVDQWARHYAVLSLTGVSDTYTHGNPHNLRVYQRPSDGRFISLPHDMDTSFQRATNVALMGGTNWNLVKIFQRPQFSRLFYGNLYDLIETTYNTDYMQRWTQHYGDLAGSSFSGILSYIGARSTFVRSQLNIVAPQVPFAITTNGGVDFTVAASGVTLSGNGWIDVHQIRFAGSDSPLDVTWLDNDSWTTTIPLAYGTNLVTLEAVDRGGSVVGTDTISVTSSVSERPYRDFLRITELHYNPMGGSDGEFIELQNTSSPQDGIVLDLSGVKISSGPSTPYEFSAGRMLGPGDFVLVVNDRNAFLAIYPHVDPALIDGEYTGNLSNAGEMIQLEDPDGATIVEFEYEDGELWPERADGTGASLEMVDPIGTDADQVGKHFVWRGSTQLGGSPGAVSTPPIGVVINEVLSHTDLPGALLDAIELSNVSAAAVDIGGWYLSDSADNLLKFQIPPGTILPPGGTVVFTEEDFNPSQGTDPAQFPNDFALNGTQGDNVWLTVADGMGGVTTFVDDVHFGPSRNGQSLGRVPGAAGRLAPLQRVTLGCENSPGVSGPIVISELQYNPGDPSPAALAIEPELVEDDLEFIEIHNPTLRAVDLSEWHLRAGIDFDFATGTSLAPGEVLVVVSFDPDAANNADRVAAFRVHYGIDEDVVIVGGFAGQMSDSGELIRLERPMSHPEGTFYVVEDSVVYDDRAPWPVSADGADSSLSRRHPAAFGDSVDSWLAHAPSPGSVASGGVVPGDVDGDGQVTAGDVDRLFDAVSAGRELSVLDLNGDLRVDSGDVAYLVETILATRFGDANLDGQVDGEDWGIWNEHRFQSCGSWESADFNGDGVTDGRDFNLWQQNRFTGSAAAPSGSGSRAAARAPLAVGPAIAAVELRDDFIEQKTAKRRWQTREAIQRRTGAEDSAPSWRVVDQSLRELFIP